MGWIYAAAVLLAAAFVAHQAYLQRLRRLSFEAHQQAMELKSKVEKGLKSSVPSILRRTKFRSAIEPVPAGWLLWRKCFRSYVVIMVEKEEDIEKIDIALSDILEPCEQEKIEYRQKGERECDDDRDSDVNSGAMVATDHRARRPRSDGEHFRFTKGA